MLNLRVARLRHLGRGSPALPFKGFVPLWAIVSSTAYRLSAKARVLRSSAKAGDVGVDKRRQELGLALEALSDSGSRLSLKSAPAATPGGQPQLWCLSRWPWQSRRCCGCVVRAK